MLATLGLKSCFCGNPRFNLLDNRKQPFKAMCICRRRFQACPGQLEAAGHAGAKKLFDVVAPPLHEITDTTLLDNGRFRSDCNAAKGCCAVTLPTWQIA